MSKRSEEKKKQEYYRREIGKMLEEAYLSMPVGDLPTEEKMHELIELANKRRAEKLRRKRMITSTVCVLTLCCAISITICLNASDASADNAGGVEVNTEMETSDTYTSLDALPQTVRDEFVIFDQYPEGYQVTEVKVSVDSNFKRLSIQSLNSKDEEIIVKETVFSRENKTLATLNPVGTEEKWGDLSVYVDNHSTSDNAMAYTLMHNDIYIVIKTPISVSKEEVKNIVLEKIQK